VSIGQRIAVIAVLAICIGMTLFATYTIRVRTVEMNRGAEAEAAGIASTLDVVLNTMLEHDDVAALGALPGEIQRAQHIFGLAIYDSRSGGLTSSSRVISREPEVRALAERVTRTGGPVQRALTFGDLRTLASAFPLVRGDTRVGAVVVLRDLSYIEASLRGSRVRSVASALVLSLLMVAVVLGVTRRTVSRPVAELIAGVRRIGSGDLTHAIPMRSRDEIGRIAEALNTMMTDLTAARVQIRRDLEARIALEKSVEFERKLQHAQRLAAVGQVAASLAHEIGSPLHVIAGRARFAAGRRDPKEMAENLVVIATQADRITRVVEQMLSIARRRGRRVERVRLADVARTTLELLGPQGRQQNVALTLTERTPDVATTGDPDALQQVLFNLVLNAVQAQPGGGSVEVLIEAVEEPDSMGTPRARAVMEVRDRGPGVPAGQHEAIFEPFATGREGKGGTGLGLAVVREIAREHAGTVRVHDPPEGGAAFRVSLPSHDESTPA
jgi:signal transduction histidine kinase